MYISFSKQAEKLITPLLENTDLTIISFTDYEG